MNMNALELKIPPPLVWLVCAALVWQTAATLPGQVQLWPWLVWLPILGSLVLGFPAVRAFVRAQTTVHPHQPSRSSSLVTGGVYRVSRNPMYLALALLLLAWVLYWGNILGLVWLAVFVLYITRFQIVPEERALAAKFGQAYRDYCERVRRWI